MAQAMPRSCTVMAPPRRGVLAAVSHPLRRLKPQRPSGTVEGGADLSPKRPELIPVLHPVCIGLCIGFASNSKKILFYINHLPCIVLSRYDTTLTHQRSGSTQENRLRKAPGRGFADLLFAASWQFNFRSEPPACLASGWCRQAFSALAS